MRDRKDKQKIAQEIEEKGYELFLEDFYIELQGNVVRAIDICKGEPPLHVAEAEKKKLAEYIEYIENNILTEMQRREQQEPQAVLFSTSLEFVLNKLKGKNPAELDFEKMDRLANSNPKNGKIILGIKVNEKDKASGDIEKCEKFMKLRSDFIREIINRDRDETAKSQIIEICLFENLDALGGYKNSLEQELKKAEKNKSTKEIQEIQKEIGITEIYSDFVQKCLQEGFIQGFRLDIAKLEYTLADEKFQTNMRECRIKVGKYKNKIRRDLMDRDPDIIKLRKNPEHFYLDILHEMRAKFLDVIEKSKTDPQIKIDFDKYIDSLYGKYLELESANKELSSEFSNMRDGMRSINNGSDTEKNKTEFLKALENNIERATKGLLQKVNCEEFVKKNFEALKEQIRNNTPDAFSNFLNRIKYFENTKTTSNESGEIVGRNGRESFLADYFRSKSFDSQNKNREKELFHEMKEIFGEIEQEIQELSKNGKKPTEILEVMGEKIEGFEERWNNFVKSKTPKPVEIAEEKAPESESQKPVEEFKEEAQSVFQDVEPKIKQPKATVMDLIKMLLPPFLVEILDKIFGKTTDNNLLTREETPNKTLLTDERTTEKDAANMSANLEETKSPSSATRRQEKNTELERQ